MDSENWAVIDAEQTLPTIDKQEPVARLERLFRLLPRPGMRRD